MPEFDYQKFDRIWDEDGPLAAHMSLPTQDDAMEIGRDNFHEKERCVHCGKLPYMILYGPYRIQRSISDTVLRKIPQMIEGSTEGIFCDCWEPTGGYEASLETK